MNSSRFVIWFSVFSLLIIPLSLGFSALAAEPSSVKSINCPLYTPPPPGWCDGGEVVSGEISSNGCPLPPSCVGKAEIPETKTQIVEIPKECTPGHPCETKSVKVESVDGSTDVVEDGLTVRSTVPVKIEESRMTTTIDGKKEMVILPSQVKKVVETEVSSKLVPGESKIQKMELTTCTSAFSKSADCSSNTSIYETSVERVDKLFGFIPVKSQVNYTVGASNGQVLSVAKPWYLNLFSAFFQ